MGCFCKSAMGPLQLALPSLNVAMSVAPPGAQAVLALSAWLGARGLPASPWVPDPAWLQITPPSLLLRAETLATLSAMATLRAQVLAQFGLDLLVPAQANMFARLAATLNARLSAMAAAGLSIGTGQAWLQLGALNFAIDQITLALQAGLFTANAGAYVIAPAWQSFLAALLALLPLIALSVQLGLDLRGNFAADLAVAVRAMLAVRLPALPAANLAMMASLSAQLTAVASLAASLGIAPLQIGLPGVQAMISARLSALLAALSASLGINLTASLEIPNLLGLLPALPACPTLAITPAVVQAALTMNASALAALTWQAPAGLPLLQVGLPVATLSAQLSAALGISAALAPCPAGCDANAVLRAAFSA